MIEYSITVFKVYDIWSYMQRKHCGLVSFVVRIMKSCYLMWSKNKNQYNADVRVDTNVKYHYTLCNECHVEYRKCF